MVVRLRCFGLSWDEGCWAVAWASLVIGLGFRLKVDKVLRVGLG